MSISMKESISKPLACTPGASREEGEEAVRKEDLERQRREEAGPERSHLGGWSYLPLMQSQIQSQKTRQT